MKAPHDDARAVRIAARLLARRADDAEAGAPTTLPDRAASIAAIERALRARGQRRIAPWLGWGVAAAAAAVLLSFGWRTLRSSERVVSSGLSAHEDQAQTRLAIADVDGSGTVIETPQGVRPATRGERVAAGTFVRVPGSGHLLLALDTGTRLRVGASSRVRLSALDALQRFDVESGTLEADVAKVQAGGRFIVATGDAEVEVKGTRFEVAVVGTRSACAPFVHTQVVVQEGVVVVRFAGGEARVSAGSAWPDCPLATTAVHVPQGRTRAAHAPAPTANGAGGSPQAADRSTLAAQNDLFAAALAARRRGDLDEAIQWLDRLIGRFPQGPLVNNARAERQRLLELRRAGAPSE